MFFGAGASDGTQTKFFDAVGVCRDWDAESVWQAKWVLEWRKFKEGTDLGRQGGEEGVEVIVWRNKGDTQGTKKDELGTTGVDGKIGECLADVDVRVGRGVDEDSTRSDLSSGIKTVTLGDPPDANELGKVEDNFLIEFLEL